MNKTFALGALSVACSAAMAQSAPGSSVTIYGIVDAGVTQVSGVRGGSIKQLSSGIMDGSRLGVRGNEDLGGGYRAIFTLEHRLELDTGSASNRPPSGSQAADRFSQASRLGLPGAFQPVVSAVAGNIGAGIGVNLGNNFWDRQTFVGLITPFGGFLAGRQYTPAYEISAVFDTMQTSSALAAGQVASIPAGFDIRLANALQYRIVLGGLTASAMVAAGEGSATSGKFFGGMAMYRAKGWSAGLGYNTRENERGAKSLTNVILGATVNIGPGTLSGMYATIEDNNPSGLSGIAASITPQVGAANAALISGAFVNALRQDAKLLHVGYRLPLGANTIYATWSKHDDTRPANADTTSYGIGYTYSLSKRTDLNVIAARFVNSANAQAAPGGAGYLGGVTASAGTDSTSLALGVRHRF
ncbi:MAG: porin [Rubrivivax sp.]|nr:porin [Rubrivivax sp.]